MDASVIEPMDLDCDGLLDFTVYNPGAISKETLLEEFTARHDMLNEILDIIKKNRPNEPQQHILIIGPRGMGKTFTLWAVAYNAGDIPELDNEWIPVIFSEENYGMGDLADFWLESLRRLQETIGSFEDRAEALLIENPADLAEKAKNAFLELISKHNKRAIMLLDNINEIFQAITNETELHNLRAFLMEDPRVMIIGSSPTYFSQTTDVDKPFFDFFRVFILERFQRDEMEDVLRKIAEARNDENVIYALENQPERGHSLRIFTGGNPRLVKMAYRLLAEGADGDVRKDLQRMLDDCTPYFKHRIETLKTQARRVFDAIARKWDPVTVSEISLALRKPSNYISAQIKRLVDEGFIEEAGGGEKKKMYQVAERFYNIYYLMRFSRSGRQRLSWLVGFMRVFYKASDYRKWCDKTVEELKGIENLYLQEERLAFLSSMASAAEEPALKRELFHKTVRAVIDTAGIKALSNIIDGNLKKAGFAADFSILEFLSGLPETQQKEIGYRPEDCGWWYSVARVLRQNKLLNLAEQANKKSIELDSGNAFYLNCLGDLLCDLKRFEEAEDAYRKAIKLDNEDAYSWNSLGYLLRNHLKRFEEAEEAHRNAIKLDPEYVFSWDSLGNLLRNLKRFDEAEEAYRKAIRLDPENVFSWICLGRLLCDLKRFDEAEKAHRKAIKLDPEYSNTYLYLAILFIKKGRASEALGYAVKSICLRPNVKLARYIFLKACPDSAEPWLEVMPNVMLFLKNNLKNNAVYEFALEGFIRLARFKKEDAVAKLIKEHGMDERFEPLILALKTRENIETLKSVSPERRALVRDVMARIDGSA